MTGYVKIAPRKGVSADYAEGYRCAIRRAVAYLHAEAAAMKDPRAEKVLNAAAHGLGSAASQERATTYVPATAVVADEALK